jgi:uncharacterized protein (DUF3820 family)
MVMTKRLDYYEVSNVIQEFTDTAKNHFGTHGYSTGYLGSMLNQLMMEVPVNRQKELVDQLKNAVAIYME